MPTKGNTTSARWGFTAAKSLAGRAVSHTCWQVDVARVIGGVSRTLPSNGPVELLILKDGVPIRTETVTSDDFSLPFTTSAHGRYRLQVQQGPFLQDVSSPIYFQPLPPRPGKGCGDANHAHERAGECR